VIGQLHLNVLHRTGEYPSFDLDLLTVQHQGYRGALSLDGNTRSGFEAILIHNSESRSLTTRHGQGKVERHSNSTVFTLDPVQVIFNYLSQRGIQHCIPLPIMKRTRNDTAKQLS